MDYPELVAKYKVDRNAPLPTGEPIEKLADVEKEVSTTKTTTSGK
jgi:hypothetical protein